MRASLAVSRTTTELKRDLLLFDRVMVMGLSHMIRGSHPDVPVLDERRAVDCEYLQSEGVLLDGPSSRWEVAQYVTDRAEAELTHLESQDPEEHFFHELNARARAHLLASSARHPAGKINHLVALPSGGEIVVAYAEGLFEPHSAVPVLSQQLSRDLWESHAGSFLGPALATTPRVEHVAEVLIRRLPVPGDQVPLEDVVAFSRAPETRRQVESLRLWMFRMALKEAPMTELELEVDSLLHDFDQHMRAADMRSGTSALRLAVSVPLQVVEELLHLKPKAAVDSLFGVATRRAERLEAELGAPGRELAYLRSAVRAFGDS